MIFEQDDRTSVFAGFLCFKNMPLASLKGLVEFCFFLIVQLFLGRNKRLRTSVNLW